MYGFLMQGIGSLETSLCFILVTDMGTVSVPVLARGKIEFKRHENYVKLFGAKLTCFY